MAGRKKGNPRAGQGTGASQSVDRLERFDIQEYAARIRTAQADFLRRNLKAKSARRSKRGRR